MKNLNTYIKESGETIIDSIETKIEDFFDSLKVRYSFEVTEYGSHHCYIFDKSIADKVKKFISKLESEENTTLYNISMYIKKDTYLHIEF